MKDQPQDFVLIHTPETFAFIAIQVFLHPPMWVHGLQDPVAGRLNLLISPGGARSTRNVLGIQGRARSLFLPTSFDLKRSKSTS